MAWLAVDKDGIECIYEDEPIRSDYNKNYFWWCGVKFIELPKGSIEKLIGKVLTWEDEPYELK